MTIPLKMIKIKMSRAGAPVAIAGMALCLSLVGMPPALSQTAALGNDMMTFAEPQSSITLDAAIRLALESNPGIAAARREIEAAQAHVMQSALRPNPDFLYSAEDSGNAYRTSSAEIDLPIETAGKREARIDAAVRGGSVAVSDLRGRQIKVRSSVMVAFFEVLAAQEQATLTRDALRLAQRATDVAVKRVTAGKVSPVEETKARVAEAGVRVALLQAESDLRSARSRLSSLWGNPAPRFTEVVGEIDRLPELPKHDVVQQRLNASPLVERARLELERRQSLVVVEQSKTVPDFSVTVGVKRREDSHRDQLLVGVKVPLPVFNRNQGNLLEALRREDKARDELLATQVSLSSEVLQALERISARRDEAELLRRDIVPGARSAYEAATIGFENGKFSFLEVLDAQRTYFTAKTQYLGILSALHRAVTDLEGLLGQAEAGNAMPSTKE